MCSRRHKSLGSVVHSAAFTCFSMGFNAGIIAGALLYLQDHFASIRQDAVLRGAVTASVFASAFAANTCIAPIIDRFGRTRILYLLNIPFVAGALVTAFATDATEVIAGRTITGIAVGVAGTLPNLYIAEIVPPESRGRYVGMAPLYGTTGIMAAQFCSWIIAEVLGQARCSDIGWRIMFGMGALPSIIQLLWSMGLPESPRWCRQRGLHDKAEESIQYLSGLGVDMNDMSVTPITAQASGEKLGGRRAAIAIGLSVMQQLSGVNAVIYYAPHLYTQLGVQPNIAILIASLNSVAQVMMTRIMTLVIDSWGRRRICLIGLVGMFIGLALLGLVFTSFFDLSVGFAVAGILIFRLSFSLSLGPLPYIMVTELFPQRHRARGVAMSMMTNWGLNWAVVFAVPELMRRWQGGVFFAFAGVCVISGIVVDLYLPETSGRSLDDISSSQDEGCLRKVFRRRNRRTREPRLLRQIPYGDSEYSEPPSTLPSGISIPKVEDIAAEVAKGNPNEGSDENPKEGLTEP